MVFLVQVTGLEPA